MFERIVLFQVQSGTDFSSSVADDVVRDVEDVILGKFLTIDAEKMANWRLRASKRLQKWAQETQNDENYDDVSRISETEVTGVDKWRQGLVSKFEYLELVHQNMRKYLWQREQTLVANVQAFKTDGSRFDSFLGDRVTRNKIVPRPVIFVRHEEGGVVKSKVKH